MLAYLFDAGLKDQLNEAGRSYWDVYLEEICNLMGVRGRPLSVDEAAEIAAIPEIGALVVGRQTSAILTEKTRAALASWVEEGGILIGFAATGLDEVFDIERQGVVKQPGDDYTIAAHFDLRPHDLTHEIHPLMFMEQRLLIISDVEPVKNHAGAELGRLFSPEGVDMGCAALTWGRCGKGWAGYFAFDVAQTVWVLHQGRPIALDAKQTRGYPRAYDLCVLGNNSRKVAYADELVFLVQNMVAQGDTAFVHQIPPEEGQVADALFYWGGDEYTGPTELSLYASDWMKSQGLPYHINIQAENHPMTEAEYQHILDNGHEVSEYYHMLAEDGWAAHEQLYARQSREFYDRFGRWPITIACDALEAGLHVMVEVPLTYSLDDCWKLVTTVERTGKIFMLMEQLRYSGYVRAWRHLIDKGVIGKPLFVEGQYFHYLPGMHYMDEAGMFYPPEQGADDERAQLTWRAKNPPIGYLPHELSPMLYAINDRVVRVVGMSTRPQSYKHPELKFPDMQVALMHTANDVIMRMAVNFGTPTDHGECHWHHIKGVEGAFESPRRADDTYKMYADGWQIPATMDVPWSRRRIDAPPGAAGSGHGDLDYYVFAHFADAALHDMPLDIDVYGAVETAAPAILAAKSMAEGNAPQEVPDFRPGPQRRPGQMPK